MADPRKVPKKTNKDLKNKKSLRGLSFPSEFDFLFQPIQKTTVILSICLMRREFSKKTIESFTWLKLRKKERLFFMKENWCEFSLGLMIRHKHELWRKEDLRKKRKLEKEMKKDDRLKQSVETKNQKMKKTLDELSV